MRPARAAIPFALAAALALTGCAARDTSTSPSSAPTTPVEASTAQVAQPTASPTGPCEGDDYSLSPGDYCIYPSKVKWLSADILPVDPETLDWSDPDAVAKAYVITSNVWDSRDDKSGSYALRRAAIFTEQGRTSPDTSDPDQARGQAEFTTTWKRESYTTVKINSVTSETSDGDPQQSDGSWQRVVNYTRTVHTRTDSETPYVVQGFVYVTLDLDPDSGQWLITQATTAQEVTLN